MEGDFELEKIRQEIAQEKQMKEMLEQSAAELRATVEELENRYDTIDNEGNEWKTRYETQTEINEQLERQILNLQNKVQEAKSNLKDEEEKEKEKQKEKEKEKRANKNYSPRKNIKPKTDTGLKSKPKKATTIENKTQLAASANAVKTRTGLQSRSSMNSNPNQGSLNDSKPGSANTKTTGITINIALSPREAGKTPRDMNRYDDLADANPHMIKMLEREKQMLSSQLRDLEWRLDQESKAYHKANTERRNFQSEIKSTKAYHKANDERKSYNLEINNTKQQQGEMTSRQRVMGSREHLDTISGPRTPRDLSRWEPSVRPIKNKGPITTFRPTTKAQSHKDSLLPLQRNDQYSHRPYINRKPILTLKRSNIPEDQRIIDPKRGPIKKTAGVKNLPSLDMT